MKIQANNNRDKAPFGGMAVSKEQERQNNDDGFHGYQGTIQAVWHL